MILKSQRDLFDIPRDTIYFNAAYMTPATKRMEEIGKTTFESLKHPWNFSPVDFFTLTEETRSVAGDLLGVSAETLAFVPSASYGIATAARNITVNKGEVILLLEGQFPSNVYEWQEMAHDRSAEILTVKEPIDHDWTTAILECLQRVGERLALAALPNVHWSNGALIDLEKIVPLVRANGAALVLDLTQSLGAMKTNLSLIDPDFAVTACYKWLFGPYSTGLLYVAPRHHEGQPLEKNWIVRAGSEDFTRLVNYQDEYQHGARRFDVGERSNFTLMPLLQEAFRQIGEWGIENIAETLNDINCQLSQICCDAGFKPIPDQFRGPHMLGVDVGLEKGEILMIRLKDAGVSASLRGSMLRIAPHLWVDDYDIEQFKKLISSL